MPVIPSLPYNDGALNYRRISTADTNLAVVKAGPGNLRGVQISNTGTMAFLKLYNLAVNPTLASSVPVATIALPATTGNIVIDLPNVTFDTGVAIAITGLVADTDTTSVAAAQVILNLMYN